MTLSDYIVIAVITLILGGAIAYIIKSKKSGKRCIGCPDGAHCNGACESCSSFKSFDVKTSDSSNDSAE